MAGLKCRIALNCEYVTVKVTECVLVVMSGLFCKRYITEKAKLLCLLKEIDYFEGKSFIDHFYQPRSGMVKGWLKKWFRPSRQFGPEKFQKC